MLAAQHEITTAHKHLSTDKMPYSGFGCVRRLTGRALLRFGLLLPRLELAQDGLQPCHVCIMEGGHAQILPFKWCCAASAMKLLHRAEALIMTPLAAAFQNHSCAGTQLLKWHLRPSDENQYADQPSVMS
jgi:hypothetical protein